MQLDGSEKTRNGLRKYEGIERQRKRKEKRTSLMNKMKKKQSIYSKQAGIRTRKMKCEKQYYDLFSHYDIHIHRSTNAHAYTYSHLTRMNRLYPRSMDGAAQALLP